MRRFVAMFVAKMAMVFSRALKRGGGSALPGYLALKLDKSILTELTKNLRLGAVIITGTNGKTTTSKMLTDILKTAGMDVVTNKSGSNLSRGLVSTLIERSNFIGTKTRGDIGVFEIDEATMPKAVPTLSPRLILVTNLFRDQLDRYGEIDKTAELIGNSLRYAKDATIILNADDPLVASLSGYNQKAIYFGIEDSKLNDKSEQDRDNRDCLSCGAQLKYEIRYFSHIGKYECPKCGLKRPTPENTIYKVDPHTESTDITLHTQKKENTDIKINVAGLYNVYNALAASSIASALDVSKDHIKHGLENSSAAFGRMEKIKVKDKYVYLLLVKNPTGFTESIKSIISNGRINVMFSLNDKFADGTDISWIWDAELELMKNKVKNVTVSGIRSEDMALRLKYANINMDKVNIEKNVVKAMEKALSDIMPGETLYVLPTYTIMMEIRSLLVKQGYAQDFWEE